MENMYLLVLQGGGDENIRLVNSTIWNWVISDYQYYENGYEPLSKEVLSEFKKYNKEKRLQNGCILVSSGSFDNDRAILAPGMEFASLTEAFSYAKENDINIVDEYYGNIY